MRPFEANLQKAKDDDPEKANGGRERTGDDRPSAEASPPNALGAGLPTPPPNEYTCAFDDPKNKKHKPPHPDTPKNDK